MDELLIAEVQKHEVIYNRQKYFLINNAGPEKYGNKDDAWNYIAMKLGTDVDTCKKRWKYLRERYVQQRKQGDPPTYEHLSRPYLEKMKFLDQHIQPRKSYRNVSNFLPSPNANAPFGELIDSSRSNGSLNNIGYNGYNDSVLNEFKADPEQSFQSFSPINHTQSQSQQQQKMQSQSQQQPQQQQQQQQQQQLLPQPQKSPIYNNRKPPIHPISSKLQNTDFRDNEVYNIPSSSSSMKSPSTPETHDSVAIKKSRIDHNNTLEDSSDNEDLQNNHSNIDICHNNNSHPQPPFPSDLFHSIFQQQIQTQRQIRTSEQLLGELVTVELLKMNKERRKSVQKRILEILFFDE